MRTSLDLTPRNVEAIDKVRIAAFTKYDREAASTRQRLLQFLPEFERAGIEVDYHPLLGDAYVRGLATGKPPSRLAIGRDYARRIRQLLRSPSYDLIWIYAELFPWLPSGFERLAFRKGRPVIYDCDDAFFVPYDNHPNTLVRSILGGKLQPLMAGAVTCCCGNRYLRDYAAQFCPRTMILPTVVDTARYRPATPQDRAPVIGWIGSPTTWPNVRPLLPLLAELCRAHEVRMHAVGAGTAADSDRFDGLNLVEWSEASEIAEVQAMDIGIMPLDDLPFQRGKSGYKLIQYMACGLPVVASPVGVNAEIVGATEGFLASSEAQWRVALTTLIGDAGLRRAMGAAGRARVKADYSLATHAPRLIELMQSLVR